MTVWEFVIVDKNQKKGRAAVGAPAIVKSSFILANSKDSAYAEILRHHIPEHLFKRFDDVEVLMRPFLA